MVLAIKLETSRRLSRARELSYLLVSYLSLAIAMQNPTSNHGGQTKAAHNKETREKNKWKED
jgi:hypothetical protein